MNPSSAGWIKKFIKEIDQKALCSAYDQVTDLYQGLKAGGFCLFGRYRNQLRIRNGRSICE